MGKPLSMDLRVRVLAAVDSGLSCRAAAARFGVAASTAIKWFAQRRATGDIAPKPQGGDVRSRPIEVRRDEVFAVQDGARDATLSELRDLLAERGLIVSIAAVYRFFQRHGITRKKRPRTPSSRIVPTS